MKAIKQEEKFKIRHDKNVKDVIHGYIGLTPLEVFVIDSPIFQRLRGISQVPFGFMVYPSHSVKRFEHSIGVMHLAGRVIETAFYHADDEIKKEYLENFVKDIKMALNDDIEGKKNILNFLKNSVIAPVFDDSQDIESLLNNKEFSDVLKNIVIQLTRIMGLLHDIGHLPFSHLGEEIIEVIMNESIDGKEDLINKIVPLYTSFLNSYPDKINSITGLPEYPIHELNTYYIATTLLREYAGKNPPNDNKLKELEFYLSLLGKAINKVEIQKYKAFRTLLGIIDNDIDVDRADYFLRDGITSGIGFGSYDLERLVSSMRLIKTRNDFIIRPNTSAVSAVETFVTERFKLHRWLYFHPIVILFETCFVNLLKLIVKEYRDLEILEMFHTPKSYDAVPSSFIYPEADIVTRIKNHFLTISKKATSEPRDKFFLTLYSVIYFKNKSCRPLWQKQGDYYINFHSKIVTTARAQKVRKSDSEDIHEYIHTYFRNLAEDLNTSKNVVDTLRGVLGENYNLMITVKRFKPIKAEPTDATCAPRQYVIVGKEEFIGIEEYPAIKAIEETWYKEIPINIYIASKGGSEISRDNRDKMRKKIEDFFFSNDNNTKFSFNEFINFIK
ncbi:MAG: HD domain-containing protein [Thermodesulfovibrionales bacterium]|nr:HD domain-containing protein [Thermodesulfovibrionales bacterium]